MALLRRGLCWECRAFFHQPSETLQAIRSSPWGNSWSIIQQLQENHSWLWLLWGGLWDNPGPGRCFLFETPLLWILWCLLHAFGKALFASRMKNSLSFHLAATSTSLSPPVA